MTPSFKTEEAKAFYQTCMEQLEEECTRLSTSVDNIHKKNSPKWTEAVFELARMRLEHTRDAAHRAFQLEYEITSAEEARYPYVLDPAPSAGSSGPS